MRSKTIPIVAALLLVCGRAIAQHRSNQSLPRLNGRAVTLTESQTDPDGYPKGPASVCVEAPPQRQCYTAPKDFGRNPTVSLVQLKGLPALFFSAVSGGVSGFRIHFALLQSGNAKNLEDLFVSDSSVSNQSQNEFWTDPTISDAPFFVTADYILGPDESHYSRHRYLISAFVQKHSLDLDGDYYYLQDRYMTSRIYDREAHDDILSSEKVEILVRLRRIKLDESTRRLGQ